VAHPGGRHIDLGQVGVGKTCRICVLASRIRLFALPHQRDFGAGALSVRARGGHAAVLIYSRFGTNGPSHQTGSISPHLRGLFGTRPSQPMLRSHRRSETGTEEPCGGVARWSCKCLSGSPLLMPRSTCDARAARAGTPRLHPGSGRTSGRSDQLKPDDFPHRSSPWTSAATFKLANGTLADMASLLDSHAWHTVDGGCGNLMWP